MSRNGFAHAPPRRASATPAKPPITVAMTVLPMAILNEFVRAFLSASLVQRSEYGSVLKLSHTRKARPLLKEWATTNTIGRNRKT